MKYLVISFALFLVICPKVEGQNYATGLSQEYLRSAVLDAQQNFYLFWNYTDTHITFEVNVNTTGWVGLGISPNGGMIGADIQVGWVKNGVGVVTDRHGTDSNTFPPIDTEQNVELLASAECGGWTMIKYRRQLAACEANDDLPITADTLKVIYAYGPTDPTGNDITSANYHGTTRGVRSLLILDGPSNAVEPPASETRQEFTFLNSNFQIPAVNTHYSCTLFKVPDLSSKVHLIEIEPIVEAGNEFYVHHILLYQCFGEDAAFDAILGTTAQCYSENMPNDFNSCRGIVHSWAIGGTSFSYPLHVGLPLGEADSPKYILMETHYDNPNLRNDVIDNSGLKLIFTPQLRQFDAGVMEVGHTVSPYTMLVPPNANNYLLYGECTSECLGVGLNLINITEINVFGSLLHAHLLGSELELKHIRNGEELEPLAKDSAYDFNYQETRILSEERVIQLGDELQMVCNYPTTERSEFTQGGLGTTQEMCLTFMFYYPKIPLAFCETAPDFVSMLNYFGITGIEFVPIGIDDLNNLRITAPASIANQTFGNYLSSLNFNNEMAQNMSDTFRYILRNQNCLYGTDNYPVSLQTPATNITQPFVNVEANCMAPTTGFPTTGISDASCFTTQAPITTTSGGVSLKSITVLAISMSLITALTRV